MLLVSCGKLPQTEIDAANLAIENAKIAGAEMYLQNSYVMLQDSMKSVMAGIEAQKSKFFKNYSSSVEQLAGVTQFAREVMQQTEARKVEIKDEIQTTITEAQALIESNKALILEAPKGKEGTAALEAIKQEISTVESAIMEAGQMLETGELLSTLDKAKAAHAKATSINAELTEVIAKYKARVGKR